RPSDEHGIIDATALRERPKRGAKVLLVPGHCDPTVNLHDWYVGVRGLGGGEASVRWPRVRRPGGERPRGGRPRVERPSVERAPVGRPRVDGPRVKCTWPVAAGGALF